MKTIAWDVDDVLNGLMQTWFETVFRPERPDCTLGYEDLRENPPDRILNLTRSEYLVSLDKFRLSGCYDELPPSPQVLAWFQCYGSRYRHIALTAVPRKAAKVSSNWVLHHFGEWIRTFHFVPSPRHGEQLPRYDMDKGTYLQWFGKVDLLVDDNVENICAAESVGVQGVVFPQPWNQSNFELDDLEKFLNIQRD